MLKNVMIFVLLLLVLVAVLVAQDNRVVEVSGVREIVEVLSDELIYLYQYKQTEIGWDKSFVEARPAGAIIQLKNNTTMVREDWLAKAEATIADLQTRIDRINATR